MTKYPASAPSLASRVRQAHNDAADQQPWRCAACGVAVRLGMGDPCKCTAALALRTDWRRTTQATDDARVQHEPTGDVTMTTKKTPTLEEISQAVLMIWLRTKCSASSEDIATELKVSTAAVRRVITATSRFDIDCSRVPGCDTHMGRHNGHGRTPTTWSPDKHTLCALIRGEGTGTHQWRVEGHALPMRRNIIGPHDVREDVTAATEADALRTVREQLVAKYGELHGNTRLDVVWLGRVADELPAELVAEIAAASDDERAEQRA